MINSVELQLGHFSYSVQVLDMDSSLLVIIFNKNSSALTPPLNLIGRVFSIEFLDFVIRFVDPNFLRLPSNCSHFCYKFRFFHHPCVFKISSKFLWISFRNLVSFFQVFVLVPCAYMLIKLKLSLSFFSRQMASKQQCRSTHDL